MTQLLRKHDCFNPMFLNDKEINHLVFYDCIKGETILSPENENVRWFGSNNNQYPEINFPFAFKRGNKVDLTRKDAFYTSYAYKYNFDKGKIVLYIPVQLLDNFQDLGEKLDFETETDKKYLHHYSFDVMAKAIYHEIQDGELKYLTSEVTKQTLSFHGYYRTELKPLGEKVAKIAAAFKGINSNIGTYEIERMLTVCDITLK